MADTANLGLPLLAAGQAQKHVTVNEALAILDRLVMLAVKSRAFASPPPAPLEGDGYIVAAGATGDWAGRSGNVASFANGGWDFFAPSLGWRAFVEDEGVDAVFASGIWIAGAAPAPSSGPLSKLEFEHVLTPGQSNVTAAVIPNGAMVFGVTVRVLETISGATTWSIGLQDATTRYGSSLPVSSGAASTGSHGAPLSYSVETPLVLNAEGGSFDGGRVAIAIHFLLLPPPEII